MTVQERDDKAAQILEICREKKLHIACAESLTAGLLADAFVRIPGASDVFLGSAVTYTDEEKMNVLGVDPSLLEAYGAVHPQVARQMAQGVGKLYSRADEGYQDSVIGLATTGVAGPGPDDMGKPAGLVYIACALPYGAQQRTQVTDDEAADLQEEIDYENSLRSRAYVAAYYIKELHCQGDRQEVRERTVNAVLDLLLTKLKAQEQTIGYRQKP